MNFHHRVKLQSQRCTHTHTHARASTVRAIARKSHEEHRAIYRRDSLAEFENQQQSSGFYENHDFSK